MVEEIMIIILIREEEFSLLQEDLEAMIEETRITKTNGVTTINGKTNQLE